MSATIQQIETELGRIAQLVEEAGGTAERDTLVVHTPISLLAAGEVLQNWAYPQTYFIADRAYEVKSIREVHDTLQTSADGASLQVVKHTGTTAPSIDWDGLALIQDVAYTGSAFTIRGFNLKGIAVNTVSSGTLTNKVSSLTLAAGDRLVWGINGTIASTFVALTTVLKKI